MARKRIRVSNLMLFICFMLGSGILLLFPQNVTSKFQDTFTHIFRWPLSIGRNISLSARTRQPVMDAASRKEYNKLRREYRKLQNHLANVIAKLHQEHKEVEKLSRLRNRFPLEGAKLMSAYVVRASMDGSRSELMIDHGEIDGLAKGQFVLGDNSIIGTIADVWSRNARIRLITDATSRIPVKIAQVNVDGLMQGTGNNLAKIPLIRRKHKVEVGDIVYARKEPGLLDAPMIIGRVAQCKRDDENPFLWDITVKPACDVERLNDVAVIIMNPKE